MKWLLIFWASPITILATWYGLSYNDMHFGITMLTRPAHDLVFQIYGNVLGLPPETIPPLVLKAIIVDSFLLAGLVALRNRKKIMRWWVGRRATREQEPLGVQESGVSTNNLSSAP